jgi:hypothetical protein
MFVYKIIYCYNSKLPEVIKRRCLIPCNLDVSPDFYQIVDPIDVTVVVSMCRT